MARDPVDTRAARLTSQLLAGEPASDPVAVTGRLLAIQAQELRGARLAVRARGRPGLHVCDLDRALSDERTLVISWLNRGTLHLVRREDLPWLHALTTPQLAASNRRRLEQEGVSADAAERGVALVVAALADRGPLRRDALTALLDAAGVRTAGQAFIHVMYLATLRGLVVRGPVVGGAQAFALARDWLGAELPGPAAIDRDAALAELARRYLAGHGPASDRDLATWAGIGLRDARAGLAAIAGELTAAAGPDGLVDLAARAPAAPLAPPRLLGPFDPVLHGWPDRAWVLGDAQAVVTSNGIFRPIALAGGRAVATWRMPRDEVVVEPFARLPRGAAAALRADGADVRRYLGAPPA